MGDTGFEPVTSLTHRWYRLSWDGTWRRKVARLRVADAIDHFQPRQPPANFNPQEMLNSVLNAAAAGVGNT